MDACTKRDIRAKIRFTKNVLTSIVWAYQHHKAKYLWVKYYRHQVKNLLDRSM